MKYLFFISAFMFLALTGNAQVNDSKGFAKIIGRVMDSDTKQPVSYATIFLYVQGADKNINGATADENGVFTVKGVEAGVYKMVFEFMGYEKVIRENVIVKSSNENVSVGDITISPKHLELNAVTITAEKNIIENRPDKIVYNAEKDITSQGGVATDVLKKVPQVTVDIDGNVEVQGNSNIRFLIDGKPSTIFGNNINEVLQAIPASQIQSIEVITSPGAKYDAEGTGGIINIILKKNQSKGVNFSVNASAGTRNQNGSFNAGAKLGSINISAYFSGNGMIPSTALNRSQRNSEDTAAKNKSLFLQDGSSRYYRFGYQTGFDVDWDITEKDNLTFSFNYDKYSYQSKGIINQQFETRSYQGELLSSLYNTLHNESAFHSGNYDYSLDYTRKFKQKGRELTVLLNYSTDNNHGTYSQSQTLVNSDVAYSGNQGDNPGTDKGTDISIDYTHPVNDKFTIETGAKTELEKIQSNSSVYSFDPLSYTYLYNGLQSNFLTYSRNIYAAYLSANFTIFKSIDVKAGGRYEKTTSQAEFSSVGNVNIPDYNTFAPSLLFSKTFSNFQVLKLSFSHRIERPEYWVLNPYYNISDPKNISTGNPNLVPEVANNLELGYSKPFKKGGMINFSLFYRTSDHDRKSVTTNYSSLKLGDSTYNNVNLTSYANVGLEQKTGFSLYWSIPIGPKVELRSNFMVFDRYYDQLNNHAPINGIDYRLNSNISYKLNDKLTFEAAGNYNSPQTLLQGKSAVSYSYTFALRKQLWQKKGSIGLTATNPFNEYVVQRTTITGPNFVTMNTRFAPYQSFGISFTYKFGKLEFKDAKEHDSTPDPQG